MSRLGRMAISVVAVVILVTAAVVALQPDEPASRCIVADTRLVADIAEGLDYNVTGGGQMVRSDDFELVWYVAVPVNGDVGVWATDRVSADGDYTGQGLLYSVNDVARERSDYGTHTPTMEHDGAREAVACLD